MLRNVAIGTSILFGVAAAVLGGIAMAPLVPVVLIIGGIEYAWMQSQISTQLAEAEARSLNLRREAKLKNTPPPVRISAHFPATRPLMLLPFF